jgi:hypothetical protein
VNQEWVEQHTATLGRVHAEQLKHLQGILDRGVEVDADALDSVFFIGELLRLWKLVLLKMGGGAQYTQAVEQAAKEAKDDMVKVATRSGMGPLAIALFQVRSDGVRAFEKAADNPVPPRE